MIHYGTGNPIQQADIRLKVSLEKSIEGVESLYERIGEEAFRNAINKYEKINID